MAPFISVSQERGIPLSAISPKTTQGHNPIKVGKADQHSNAATEQLFSSINS